LHLSAVQPAAVSLGGGRRRHAMSLFAPAPAAGGGTPRRCRQRHQATAGWPGPAHGTASPTRLEPLHRSAAAGRRGPRADRPAGAGHRRRTDLGAGRGQSRGVSAPALRRMPKRRRQPAVRQPRPEPGGTVRSGLVIERAESRRTDREELTMPLLRLALASLTDRKSTRLNSSHVKISYAVFCLKKKKKN